MHRVNIVYTGSADSAFNWQHYLNKHLPIACGVSSRHAPIIRCDVDRPIELNIRASAQDNASTNDTIIAICTVYFSSGEIQNDFRHFFASSHQDSAQILADEPNYTKIQPSFNAGYFKSSDNTERPGSYRAKFLFPRQAQPLDTNAVETIVATLATHLDDQDIDIAGNEIDYCQFDVPPDSASAYECIVTLNFADKHNLARAARYLSTTKKHSFGEQLDVKPLTTCSEIVNFDLARCEPYLHTEC